MIVIHAVLEANALKACKDVIINHLRGYLLHPGNYNNYISDDYSMTIVTDKEPYELRSFPIIVVTGSGGPMVTLGIGNDYSSDVVDPISGETVAIQYSGAFNLTFTIEIGTRSTVQREKLTDLVALALRHILRHYMEAKGVLVKDVRFGGETEEQYDSDKIYVSTLQVDVWTQWFQTIDLMSLTKVNLDLTVKEDPNSQSEN